MVSIDINQEDPQSLLQLTEDLIVKVYNHDYTY